MDKIALIVSIISIVISIIISVIEAKRTFRINKSSLESDYFKKIFMEHLIYEIPKRRKYIRFDRNGKLKDTKKLAEELNQIRQDSLYFLYNDKLFYGNLKKATQVLEDYLVKKEDSIFLGEEQTDALNFIQEKIKNLYEIINKRYIGK